MAPHMLPPDLDVYEAAVDEVIAACDGDLRGALTALIIANEYLERDLQEALALAGAPSIADNGDPGAPINWIEVRKLSRLATSTFEEGAPVTTGPAMGDAK
jgi:hypothetical protein